MLALIWFGGGQGMLIGMNTAARLPIVSRSLLAGSSLIVLSGSVLAADLPAAKAPSPAIAASWAGFYLGVHGGYAWNRDDFSESISIPFMNRQMFNGIRSQGAVYGAHAGYNWQFGRAVTGLEIDFSALKVDGANGVSETALFGAALYTQGITLHESVKYLGSARARLGWLPTDNILLYGAAGLAWESLDVTRDKITVDPNSAQIGSDRTPLDKFGWVAGVGAEVMLGRPNWIGRIEYLHYDLGQVQNGLTSTSTVNPSEIWTSGSQTIEVVRAGVSYKFGEPVRLAPVPYAKAPVATRASTWAGFYIGAHGGYAWGRDPQSYPPELFMMSGASLTGTNSKGWIAGGQFGHNWQYDRVVTGLEVDVSAADIMGNTTTSVVAFGPSTITAALDEKVNYLGTVRGRLGWLPTDTVLLYGTAGLAWERFERGQTNTSMTVGVGSYTTREVAPSDRFGWVAGVGGEVMLGSPSWIGRLEYLHYDFGRVLDESSYAAAPPPTAVSNTVGRQTIDLVRAGVSYKFGPDGPLAAAPAIYAKAPSVATPLPGWAGFYIGGHGGYGWSENDFSRNFYLDAFVGGIKSKGWLAGGQAGYNWQYASLVGGVEIDGSATGIKGSSIPVTASTLTETQSDNVKYLGTVRGRLGWTPAPSWMLYGTGGLAWERTNRSVFDFSQFGGGNIATNISDTPRDHFGWVAGAGVESFIGNSNWIGRLEYLHYDFGTVESTVSIVSSSPGLASSTERGGRQTIETVRAGLSYKFTP
jgi:outer membrane immunogenic protein